MRWVALPIWSCKFVVEEHYCNSFAPTVVPCIGCLAVPVEHTWGNWEVAKGSVVGVAAAETVVEAAEIAGVAAEIAKEAAKIAGVARLGMHFTGTIDDTEPATPDIGLLPLALHQLLLVLNWLPLGLNRVPRLVLGIPPSFLPWLS